MNGYLIAVLAILVLGYALDTITQYLNLKHLGMALPDEVKGIYDEDRYQKSQQYLRETTQLRLIRSSLALVATIVFILIGGFNWIDEIARDFDLNSIPTGLIFIAILALGSMVLSFPFTVYSTFVIEQKYGFNTTTVRTFISDRLKGLILAVIIGGPVIAVILWFFEEMGDMAWVYAWIGVSAFILIIQFVAPILIMPLFNKFTPLEDADLKEAITDYARKQDFAMKGVFTMDGSKRSTKANAFFTGFGRSRRIVLFDTLVNNMSKAEIISVLAHEMGHYKLKHIVQGILVSIATIGLMFDILSLFMENEGLSDAFKMDEVSVYASLVFFAFLYSPIDGVISVLTNTLSRRWEYQADTYSATTIEQPEAMITALRKLGSANLANLTPHPVYVFMNYSHPPLVQRIKAINNLR
ncbi:MAG: M48 family metallopeptidase [Planctomycetes bacterium]|nr:M48 family metallopeptidase [Planctomycetota bacterium]